MSLLLLLSLLGFAPSVADAAVIAPITVEYSTTTAPLLVAAYAHHHKVDPNAMLAIISCESGGNQLVRGDKNHSRGLVQISNIYHPEVSDKQAFDPFFSMDFLARYLALGKASQWTCARNLGYAKGSN